jgi:glycosyltransferase involved in cell wall biosynthesis
VTRISVAFVVNAAGIQERRARELARRLPTKTIATTLAVGPDARGAYRAARAADVVYVIDPGRRGFPAALAARLARRRAVVEVGDPQAPLYRAQGRSAAAVNAGAAIDRIVARSSAAVVVRGRALAEILDVRVPWLELPDGVDVDAFAPADAAALRRHLGIPADDLVVGLIGSLRLSAGTGLCYGWDVVEASGLLRDEPVRALLVGDGSGLEKLRRRAAELGVADRIVFTGRVEHTQIPSYLSAMDVCVSTQSNDAVGQGRTTCKLPEYLACDRFVVATRVGTAADVLPDEMLLPYDGTVDRGHPQRLADKLRELVPRRAELRAGAGTRALALERFDYDVLAPRLRTFLEDVARG